MGTTTKGIPFPEDTDPVAQGAQAIKALANDLDFSKIVQLDPTKVVAASAATTYPMGLSAMTLSTANASAGNWPMATSSQLLNLRADADGRCAQFLFRNSSADASRQVYYRMGNSGGWAGWIRVALGGLASGSVSLPLNTAQTAGAVAVTFPSGLFGSAPSVTVARSTGTSFSALPQLYWAQSITVNGCQIGGIAAVTSSGVALTWIASDA